MLNKSPSRGGFSAIELLIYIVIFAISATFLIAILSTVTQVQIRQVSSNEVNQQLSFVQNTIQRLVRESNLIDIPDGISTTTLRLRSASSTLDPTVVFASGGVLYLAQGTSSNATTSLTDTNVTVDNFSVTKYENGGSLAVVHVDLTLSYNTTAPKGKISRSLKTAITRISAATFDSDLNPNADNSLNLGVSGINRWRNAYFSGDLDIAGRIGIGASPLSGFSVRTDENIGFTTSSVGIVLRASTGANCWRIGVTSGGGFTTTSVACP